MKINLKTKVIDCQECIADPFPKTDELLNQLLMLHDSISISHQLTNGMTALPISPIDDKCCS
jgi:hypothetical protein